MKKALLSFFIFGALLGTAYDWIHVYFSVLSYAHPHFAGTSLWVPVEFGFSALAGALGVLFLSKKIARPKITIQRMVCDAVLLFIAYFCTGIFAHQNGLTFVLLAILSAISIGSRPSAFILAASLAGAIVGPIGEIIMSSVGFFHYNVASPIPIWLPFLWVVASGLIVDTTFVLSRGTSFAHSQNVN